MSAEKILVVFGATGNQGGSVIKSILGDTKASQEFKIRGITRDPSKPNAQALASKGVECVTGDINDKESLKHALSGAHSVYAMTNYWEKMDDKLEVQQGKNIADVSKEVGVQHLIFSTLYDINKLSNGKYPNVYHFNSKWAIAEYIRSIGIPASFFMPGFYMSNLETMMTPSPQPPHAYTIALPMPPTTLIPWFDAADDTGKFVKGMLMNREKVLGKEVFAATDYTPQFKWPRRFLAKAGMPQFAQELYENMAFLDEFGYYGKGSLDWSHSILTEKPTTIAEFFAKSPKFKDMN